MFLYLGPFWIALGIGMLLGMAWVLIRYGIPLTLWAARLVAEAVRQVVAGFWAGLTGKPVPPPRI